MKWLKLTGKMFFGMLVGICGGGIVGATGGTDSSAQGGMFLGAFLGILLGNRIFNFAFKDWE